MLRKWDVRGGSTGPSIGGSNDISTIQSLIKEWKGGQGEVEGGGVLGFIQSNLSRRGRQGTDRLGGQ